jgi:uncharacterized protein (TIGR02996 family)
MVTLTSDRHAFVQAIIANPADDAPRLIYADWLEERGTEENDARAELIRLGIELEERKRNDKERMS